MKRTIIGASAAVLALTSPAVAATENYQVRGEFASAAFYQSDDCVSTGVNVWVSNNISRNSPGAPTGETQAFIMYSSFNQCTNTFSYVSGSSSNVSFKSNSSLNSASLTGVIPVSGTEGDKTLNVNLTWRGTGEVSRGRHHSSSSSPGYTVISRSTGATREAEAFGSVTLDGTNLIAGASNTYSVLGSSTSGQVTITRRNAR